MAEPLRPPVPAEGKVPPVPMEREQLRKFASARLSRGSLVWRVHRTGLGPWYFGRSGRFGLAPRRGTCYVAEDPITAICETVIRGRSIISPADLGERSIQQIPS